MGEEIKKLYRSMDERMLAGVCGGLGKYLSVDPTIIRILFIVFAFTGGGFLAYLIMWFIVPEEPVE